MRCDPVHRLCICFAFLIVFGGTFVVRAQQDDTSSKTSRFAIAGPRVWPGLPDAFALAYELDAESVSPDGRFGVIFPNARSGFESEVLGRDFLVALKPFQILAGNEGFVCFGQHGQRSMEIEWTRDSSAALLTVGGKWGTIGTTLFELHDGRVTRRIDLMAEITGLLAPKFPKGKVKPYNDTLLFVIGGPDQWAFSKDGKEVRIEVEGKTTPNHAPGLQWASTFKGTWSIPGAKWIEHKVTSKIYRNP